MIPLHYQINTLIVTLGIDTKNKCKVSMPNEAILMALLIYSEVA